MSQKKATAMVEEFIANHRHEMSIRELADATGVSKSTVSRVIRRLGVEPGGPPPAGRTIIREADFEGEARLSHLRRQAALLRRSMGEVPGAALAGLSREYRETLAEIEALEKKERPEAASEKEEANPFVAISSRFARPRDAAADQGGAVGM